MTIATITEHKSFQQVDQEVCSVEELPNQEYLERLRLEQTLEAVLEKKPKLYFYHAGQALNELLKRKLYRSSHTSFDLYCQQTIGISHSQAYRYIHAATILDNLQSSNSENQQPILPTTERQIRALNNIEPSLQREVWLSAVQKAAGQPPSNTIVTEALLHVLIKYGKVQNPYSIGEVCQIIAHNNPHLKDKNGCWCIVQKIDTTTCTVVTWDQDCTLSFDHLKSLHYCDTQRAQMQLLCDRINKLRNRGYLESVATSVLKQLGCIQRPYLIPLEENLLSTLEKAQNQSTTTHGLSK
jgi:hypothetical protein